MCGTNCKAGEMVITIDFYTYTYCKIHTFELAVCYVVLFTQVFSLTLSFSPKVLKRKAMDIIMFPLQCVSTQPQAEKEMNVVLKEQLSQKASCISLLMQSLSSLAQLAHTVSRLLLRLSLQ